MLTHLHVRNLAVVEEASVDFGSGLCVLTGETGAGKSLVVDSLSLLGGARASSDQIRTGAEVLSVTGVFRIVDDGWRTVLGEALDELGLDCEDDELVVRREVSRRGRNRVFINDQPATLRALNRVSTFLLRIHGQRDELALMEAELQRSWLDRCGGEELRRARQRCAEAYARWRELDERHGRLFGDDRMRQERIDLLRYQAQEIAGAGLVAGEEEELRKRRDLLRHAEQIARASGEATAVLIDDDDSAGAQLARARFALRPLVEWDEEVGSWLAELDDARVRIEEVGASVRQRFADAEANPAELDDIEARLALIERLLRKYGASSGEVLEGLERMQGELRDLEASDERLAALEAELAEALGSYGRAAEELSEQRSRAGGELAEAMREELGALALPAARFEVRLERRGRADSPLRLGGDPVDFHAWGVDHVVYRFSPNPGEELRPLSKVASGGELARIYLALQVAARRGDGSDGADPATLVFDEVDTGVGGKEAAVIGRKLWSLARGGQILAVTHLPQVAAEGDLHFRVGKHVDGGRTRVRVERLEGEERAGELARMLGGAEVTEVTRTHARELLATRAGG